MITAAQFDTQAQISHFGWGLAVVFAAKVLLDRPGWIALAWIAFAAVKEFWWDERFQPVDIRGSGLEDFLFQSAGAVVALAAIRIKQWTTAH